MQEEADRLRRAGRRIGVVPTMGYLHAGHLSLIHAARAHEANVVVTSIFVNPTQFAPNEDFERYPRNLERDRRLAQEAGTDILFVPTVDEMYPEPYHTYTIVEALTGVLEGASRPSHFRGVTTVVAKLFNITKPHVAVFGQKDAQQARVIMQMVRDLNFDVEIIVAPIVREPDGLAMSSRNTYLSPDERQQAIVLNQSLRHAEALIAAGERNPSRILHEMTSMISGQPSARVDYISIADSDSLQNVTQLSAAQRVLISLAVRIGKTRLIDNVIITVP
jgi:pantoate--beta-alanine ligase